MFMLALIIPPFNNPTHANRLAGRRKLPVMKTRLLSRALYALLLLSAPSLLAAEQAAVPTWSNLMPTPRRP